MLEFFPAVDIPALGPAVGPNWHGTRTAQVVIGGGAVAGHQGCRPRTVVVPRQPPGVATDWLCIDAFPRGVSDVAVAHPQHHPEAHTVIVCALKRDDVWRRGDVQLVIGRPISDVLELAVKVQTDSVVSGEPHCDRRS